MNRMSVKSSNIRTIGFDPKSNTLEVEFHKGSILQYPNVTNDEFRRLLAAKSIGSHFYDNFSFRPSRKP